MYRKNRQLSLFGFDMSGAELNPENTWIKLAEIVPWDEFEDKYAEKFSDGGPRAINARIAVGALIVKRMLGCTDERTVKHISENPYIQYFIGLRCFAAKCPFGASTMSSFRSRIDEEDLIKLDSLIKEYY